MIKRLIAISGLAFIATGCLVGPKYSRPDVAMPTEYKNIDSASAAKSSSDTTIAEIKWWELFGNEDLQKLVSIAVEQNKDIKTAIAKVEEARAVLGFTKADMYPSVTGVASINSSKEGYAYGGLSWEADIWGKLRHSNKSAFAKLVAETETANAITLSIISDVADMYFKLRSLDRQKEIAEKTIHSRDSNYKIMTERYNSGVIPEIEKLQAEQQLEFIRSKLPIIERDIIKVESAIEIALGRAANGVTRSGELSTQLTSLDVPAGLPSELLQRRPDIKQAEQLLIAQTHDIGVAEAMRFPSLKLTVYGGAASSGLSNAGVAASLFSPIFEFGKNKRRVDIQKAKAQQALFQYEKVVLNAFGEVESTLRGIQNYKDQINALQREIAANRKVLELSRDRYDAGVVTYLEVLDSETKLLDSEFNLTIAEQNQLSETVRLYKALGGGW